MTAWVKVAKEARPSTIALKRALGDVKGAPQYWQNRKKRYCTTHQTVCMKHGIPHLLTEPCVACDRENRCPQKAYGNCDWIEQRKYCKIHQAICLTHPKVKAYLLGETCPECKLAEAKSNNSKRYVDRPLGRSFQTTEC